MVISYPERDSNSSDWTPNSYEDGPGPLGLGRYHEEETVVTKSKFRWLRLCNWFHNQYERCSAIFYKVFPFLAVLSVDSAVYAWAPNQQNALIVILMANILGLLVWLGYKIRNH